MWNLAASWHRISLVLVDWAAKMGPTNELFRWQIFPGPPGRTKSAQDAPDKPQENPPTSLSVERARLMNLAYPLTDILTYLHTYVLTYLRTYILGDPLIHLDTYILRSLILGPPWGPKIAKRSPRRTLEVTLATCGRPKPRFFYFFATQKTASENMIFQHRPKTPQNRFAINFRTPKAQI